MSQKTKNRKTGGWWEDYECGCVSKTVPHKKDLLGYCATHGSDRRNVWPEKMLSSRAKASAEATE